MFPIGIDPEKFAQLAAKAVSHPDVSRLRRSLNGEKLAIGVDRLDYSKGLVNRIKAFDRIWTLQPSLARTVSLLQIATPSRGGIEAYGILQSELAGLVSDVNGRHGEVDWTPIRYLNKGFGQNVLAGLYRTAQVGVVTPLHDGMNLVAKEYVAAQNPDDPGVLVLSKFAGAANELDTALIGQSARYRWHGAHHRDRAVDAADRAADALGSDDGRNCRQHRSSIGSPISSMRCRRPISTGMPGSRWWRSRRPCGRFARPMSARAITEHRCHPGRSPRERTRSRFRIWSSDASRNDIPLITIRDAIEHGAARLVRRARIVHRHRALALADEHAAARRRPTTCCRR